MMGHGFVEAAVDGVGREKCGDVMVGAGNVDDHSRIWRRATLVEIRV